MRHSGEDGNDVLRKPMLDGTPTIQDFQIPQANITANKKAHSATITLKFMYREGGNGPLLLQAFQAALPELKLIENSDEKSCYMLDTIWYNNG
ncbi:hypothetical protein CDAR_82541 [Caerostris darwini]|uniref:Uncharacterized protein n=1 Tax=Caerostris darwini TaxID=1538125 RepID=A0AAV4UN02_9ARAC|nr:hypothetical protein CDAR_82541 [Caerostris darwini]